jgi:Helix-turn-helix domain
VSIIPPSPQARNAGPIDVRTRVTYSAIPHAILEDRRLTATDVRLIGIILKYARAKAEAWPSVATLARDLGRCPRTVQLCLRRLADAGWIVSRPAPNPTGRVLVLAWRETKPVAPPPAQRPYSQGLPRIAPEANKLPNGSEEGVSPPAPRRRPDKPMTPGEILAHYTETGWLDLPAGHPLRRMAEAGVERAMGGTRINDAPLMADSAARSRPRL